MDRTKIEWADATWNPVTGCTKVSLGCDHCYAETFAERWRGTPGHAYEQGFDLTLRPERLTQPLRWTKPRRIFVNSMSDLFHADIPDSYIAQVFAVMTVTQRHTYQVLTKRHGRLRSLLNSPAFPGMVDAAIRQMYLVDGTVPVQVAAAAPTLEEAPLPNVWLGVSVEDQQRADLRIPALLETPAAVRFLSCEPLLGPVSLRGSWCDYLVGWRTESEHAPNCDCHGPATTCPVPVQVQTGAIGWVIVGGESGRGARPMHPAWARQLRDECQAAGVPYLFKQWGEWSPNARNHKLSQRRMAYESIRFQPDGTRYIATEPDGYSAPGMESLLRVGKKAAGRELDGRTWDEYPTTTPQPERLTPCPPS